MKFKDANKEAELKNNGIEFDKFSALYKDKTKAFWDWVFGLNFNVQYNVNQEDKLKAYKEGIEKNSKSTIITLLNMRNSSANDYFAIRKENNIALEREFKSEMKAKHGDLKKMGFVDAQGNLTDKAKREFLIFTEQLADSLHRQYGKIVYYQLFHSVCSYSAKALMASEILAKIYTYDKEGNLKVSRRQKNKSIAGFYLPEEVSDYIYEHGSEYDSYEEVYSEADKFYRENNLKELPTLNFDGQNTFGKGRWIVFRRTNDDEVVYKLYNIVKNTNWCTQEGKAVPQLQNGDFYLFLDSNNLPKIAVRMYGNKVAEVRGDLSYQDIDSAHLDIAINFLENHKEFQNADRWLAHLHREKKLARYKVELENDIFDMKDLDDLNDSLYRDKELLSPEIRSVTLDNIANILGKKGINYRGDTGTLNMGYPSKVYLKETDLKKDLSEGLVRE